MWASEREADKSYKGQHKGPLWGCHILYLECSAWMSRSWLYYFAVILQDILIGEKLTMHIGNLSVLFITGRGESITL